MDQNKWDGGSIPEILLESRRPKGKAIQMD